MEGREILKISGMCLSGNIYVYSDKGSRFLLIGGKPINEPIFQYGPFVMNTKSEILKTIEDFNSGSFGKY